MNEIKHHIENTALLTYLNDCVARLEADRLLLNTYYNMDHSVLLNNPEIIKNLAQIDKEVLEHETILGSIMNRWYID